ncbi:MAG: ATP-binding protein [Thermodesulfobacteriota bacterium]|nr:ATP-binding protein [Thermodesulfobacteriota bacterium]
MLSEKIILQSAGSLSVAVMALFMLILQVLFFLRKPQYTWYAWSVVISFSALLYSVGIFFEYNTPAGPLNRFSGLLEFTVIIFLVHGLYGFTFSYLSIENKLYHPVAGVCHCFILILLWSTDYIVAEDFVTRDFIGLGSPYIEPALGPLGPVFMLYGAIASVYAMIVWIKNKRTDPKHRITYLVGTSFWILLGIHDGLATMGLPAIQYLMEYGFLGFAMTVLWVIFSDYLEIVVEKNYRSMMEAMSDSVYICSSDFRVAYMNPSMIKMIGRDATGELCHKVLFHNDEPCPWCFQSEVQQGERAETEIFMLKGKRSYNVIQSPILQEDGSVSLMAVYRDITMTKQLQHQLIRSERLSATGQLAATIAHEINSPLQGITSLLNAIKRTYNEDERLLEYLSLVKSGFISIRDTVKKLLDLNRPGNENKQLINVNMVIENTVELLKSHLNKNRVKIILNLSSGIPNITASPQQLGQVFMNLINNAIEAMTGNSKSTNAWKTTEKTGGRITINSKLRKNNITIEVADTGPGIAKEDIEYIFDPFYTSKKEMGMGIGLSLCHGIIEDHNGSITAKNSPLGGAIITITLPI